MLLTRLIETLKNKTTSLSLCVCVCVCVRARVCVYVDHLQNSGEGATCLRHHMISLSLEHWKNTKQPRVVSVGW